MSSRRPTLRWALPRAATGARVTLCIDRACARPLTSVDVIGTAYTPTADLPRGVVFWRLVGLDAGGVVGAPSPVWEFNVGSRTAPRDTSWGSVLDLNGDGYADVAVGEPGLGRVWIYMGSSAGIAASHARGAVAVARW